MVKAKALNYLQDPSGHMPTAPFTPGSSGKKAKVTINMLAATKV